MTTIGNGLASGWLTTISPHPTARFGIGDTKNHQRNRYQTSFEKVTHDALHLSKFPEWEGIGWVIPGQIVAAARIEGKKNLNLLSKHLLHQLAPHIRQPKIAAAEAEGEALVVDAEAVQDRRM